MVHVEIDHGDALRAVPLARVEGGNGGVGKNAKAHRPLAFSVVAAGTYLTEHVGDTGTLVHHSVDAGEARAYGPQRRLPGLAGHQRVGVEVDRRLPLGRSLALDPLEVGAGVGQGDGILDIVSERRLLAL